MNNVGKYDDKASAIQVVACVFADPSLLDDEAKYCFRDKDFTDDLHRTIFGCINNIRKMGGNHITINDIEDYLDGRPESKLIYQSRKGREWLEEIRDKGNLPNFDYYYNKVKKMTLLRAYESCGFSMKWLYDPDEVFDKKKKDAQEAYLDSKSLEEIAEIIDNRIDTIKEEYIDNFTEEATLIGEGIMEVLAGLQQAPEMGLSLYGKYVNNLHRGARLGKFYLRSAATGVGKTRTMIADICTIGCSEIYDFAAEKFIDTGAAKPVLYISTELDREEVSTMCLAFLSGVNEEHILMNNYEFGEYDRVLYAARLLSESPIFIEELPDFTIKLVENVIKRNIRQHGILYCFLDYLHSSLGILKEISQASSGSKLREDNILFLFSVALKDIANNYNVFILSSTQLNADYKTSETPDQNLLRGAKSIADRVDWGSILLEVTEDDKEALEQIVAQSPGQIMPNVKLSVYKNRRGSYNKMYLWMYADRSICRFDGLFATDYKYNPIRLTQSLDISIEEGQC